MCKCGFTDHGKHFHVHNTLKVDGRTIGFAIECGGSVEYLGEYDPAADTQMLLQSLSKMLDESPQFKQGSEHRIGPPVSDDCICQGLYKPLHCPVHGSNDVTNGGSS